MTTTKPFILMTGVSGFVGHHTLANFLSNGYRVRIVGRNQKSCDRVLELHRPSRSQIHTVVVPDITAPSVYDEHVQDIDGIVHLASPFVLHVEDNERDLILPALNGTKNILESAYKYGKNVKRIVITASFATIADFTKGHWPGHVYDETQWNPYTYADTKNDKRGLAYAGSKKLAEEYAWSFMNSHPDVRFTLATIHPVNVFGPPLPGSADINHLGQSVGSMYEIFKASNSEQTEPTHEPTTLPFFVDVRDVAEAHRLVFESKLNKPGRFLLAGGKYSNQGVFDFWRGGSDNAFSDGLQVQGVENTYKIDTSRARDELGLVFRPFVPCFGDMGISLKELTESKAPSL